LNLQEHKIVVRVQRDGDYIGPVKTEAGNREVDLDPKFVRWLIDKLDDKALLISQSSGSFLFPKTENAYRVHYVLPDRHRIFLDGPCGEGRAHKLHRLWSTYRNPQA
jgi:hypothetical protein